MHILTFRLYTIHAVRPIFSIIDVGQFDLIDFIHYFTIFDISQVNHFNRWVLRKQFWIAMLGHTCFNLSIEYFIIYIIIILLIFPLIFIFIFRGVLTCYFENLNESGTNSAHKCQPPRAKCYRFHCDRAFLPVFVRQMTQWIFTNTQKKTITTENCSWWCQLVYCFFSLFLSSSSFPFLLMMPLSVSLHAYRYYRVFYRLITPTYRIKWSKNPIRTWKFNCSTM